MDTRTSFNRELMDEVSKLAKIDRMELEGTATPDVVAEKERIINMITKASEYKRDGKDYYDIRKLEVEAISRIEGLLRRI